MWERYVKLQIEDNRCWHAYVKAFATFSGERSEANKQAMSDAHWKLKAAQSELQKLHREIHAEV